MWKCCPTACGSGDGEAGALVDGSVAVEVSIVPRLEDGADSDALCGV